MSLGFSNLQRVLSLAFMILMAASVSNAINCFVCQSVNGSNPECEIGGGSGETSSSLVQVNCRSVIGSVDGKTPLKASACMVLMGEYRDPATKQQTSVVSRKCTAAIQPWANAKNINCLLFDSEGHIPGAHLNYITGCAEACFDDQCNGKSRADLVERFRPKMTEYIDQTQRNDPKNPVRYPSVFALEEIKRLRDGTAGVTDAKSTGAVNLAVMSAALLGPLIFAVFSRF